MSVSNMMSTVPPSLWPPVHTVSQIKRILPDQTPKISWNWGFFLKYRKKCSPAGKRSGEQKIIHHQLPSPSQMYIVYLQEDDGGGGKFGIWLVEDTYKVLNKQKVTLDTVVVQQNTDGRTADGQWFTFKVKNAQTDLLHQNKVHDWTSVFPVIPHEKREAYLQHVII